MHAYVILVPEHVNADTVSDLVALACQRFGGLTRHAKARGYWRAPDGALIEEDMVPWEIATDARETVVLAFASLIAERLDQQCVYVRRPDGSVVMVDQEGREVVMADAMDNVRAVMIAEGVEEADRETQIKAWQHLIDTGLAWSLQGWFGRTAKALIDAGVCHA